MRILSCTFALLIATTTCAFAQTSGDADVPAAGSSATSSAPADEYFGRLQMSILGIRNQLVHLTRQVEGNPSNGDDVSGAASLTEDSIKEWEQRYPRDPWLSKTVYMLVHLYAKIPTQTGHAAATRTLSWLMSKYPGSQYADMALQEMASSTPTPSTSSGQAGP